MTNDTTPAPIGADALIDELEYAILGIPMARNFDRVRAAKAALRSALASAAQPADFDADRAMREQAAPAAVAAWMTPEGDRVVTEATMAGARKDGGAMLSSMRPYTVALVRAIDAARAAKEGGAA